MSLPSPPLLLLLSILAINQESTGRGGAGNIRLPSNERDPIPARDPDELISTGRGGAGNIRSPSRDPSRPRSIADGASPSPRRSSSEVRGRPRSGYDQDRISIISAEHDTGVHSSGRGGAGNMVRSSPSVSRSRSREPAHTTGRGGYGNAYLGEPLEKGILEVDEYERAAHAHPPGVHSTGRGGVGNLTLEQPSTEGAVHPHGADHPHASHSHDYTSTGRGGTGNISRDHSQVRT
ncbi:hypothetical protein BGW80DRAFT_1460496 [Lactifluus volemus]|nr:hypothetical protein BGW80DRAFT_1460496 [Lactifluus volemus]